MDSQEEGNSNCDDCPQDDTTVAIKKLQLQYFPDELVGKKTHLSEKIDLRVISDSLFRCGGRMANTTWSYGLKFPISLPRDCKDYFGPLYVSLPNGKEKKWVALFTCL